jgi:hypothetical protein
MHTTWVERRHFQKTHTVCSCSSNRCRWRGAPSRQQQQQQRWQQQPGCLLIDTCRLSSSIRYWCW